MIGGPSFSNDLSVEILLRLPVKQLFQLKTVSKQWLIIISSPHFKKHYNERSMRNPRLLILNESHEENTVNNHMVPFSRTLHMSTMDISTEVIHKQLSMDVSGCDYSSSSVSNLFCYTNLSFYSICHPTTNQHVRLPIASPPISSFYCGYNQHTNEYKIVHVCSTSEGDIARFKILSLKDGESIPRSWRTIENYTHIWPYIAQSVSIKCSIYWLVYNRDRTEKSIITIELNNESFTTISCPEDSQDHVYKNGDREQLSEIKGVLCLAHFIKKYSTMTLFLLQDLENSIWIKEYSINLSGMGRWIKVVGYFPGEDNNGEIIFHSDNKDLLFYNVENRNIKRVGYAGLPKRCHVSLYYDRLFSFGENR